MKIIQIHKRAVCWILALVSIVLITPLSVSANSNDLGHNSTIPQNGEITFFDGTTFEKIEPKVIDDDNMDIETLASFSDEELTAYLQEILSPDTRARSGHSYVLKGRQYMATGYYIMYECSKCGHLSIIVYLK